MSLGRIQWTSLTTMVLSGFLTTHSSIAQTYRGGGYHMNYAQTPSNYVDNSPPPSSSPEQSALERQGRPYHPPISKFVMPPGQLPPQIEVQPTLQDLVARASTKTHATHLKLKEQVEIHHKSLLALIEQHEKAPKFDGTSEIERMKHLDKLLEGAIALGESAISDEEKLRQVFATWKRASSEAGPVFRMAEEHFLKLATDESDPDAKQFYATTRLWYGGRAKRCELQAARMVPVEVEEVIGRSKKKIKAVRELIAFVKNDPYRYDQADRFDELNTFNKSFVIINDVLGRWTSQLVADLEPAPSQAEEPQQKREPQAKRVPLSQSRK